MKSDAQPRQLVLAAQLHDRHDDHRRGERQQSDENGTRDLRNRAEREQLDRARPNRRVRGEAPDLLERNVGRIWRQLRMLGLKDRRAPAIAHDDRRRSSRCARPAETDAGSNARRAITRSDQRRADDVGTRSKSERRDRRAVLGIFHRVRKRRARLARRSAEHDGVSPVGLVDAASMRR